jgi:hypothetical protein
MSEYVVRTESVLYAAERLRDAVTRGEAIEVAAERLERSGRLHEEGAEMQRAFMFEQLDAAPSPTATSQTVDEALAVALADLDVGNVLLAAGQATGETGEERDVPTLNRAVRDLGRTTELLRRGAQAAGGARQFAFEDTGPDSSVESVDVSTALETYGARSKEALDDIVRGTADIAVSVIDQLSEVKLEDIGKAVSTLGESHALPRLGRLVRLGARKIEAAIQALVRLLGTDSVKRTRSAVERFVKQTRPNGVRAAVVEAILGVGETRAAVTSVLERREADGSALDRASEELARLRVSFAAKKRLLEGISAAITLAGALGSIIFGPPVALFAAAAFLLLLAGAFLLAMDFTDSRDILRRVRGVGEIAQSLEARG